MSMGEFDAGKMRSEIHEKMGLWRVCTSDVQTQHMPGAAVSGAPAPGATEMVGQIWMEARRRREAKLMKLMHVKKYIQTGTQECPRMQPEPFLEEFKDFFPPASVRPGPAWLPWSALGTPGMPQTAARAISGGI